MLGYNFSVFLPASLFGKIFRFPPFTIESIVGDFEWFGEFWF